MSDDLTKQIAEARSLLHSDPSFRHNFELFLYSGLIDKFIDVINDSSSFDVVDRPTARASLTPLILDSLDFGIRNAVAEGPVGPSIIKRLFHQTLDGLLSHPTNLAVKGVSLVAPADNWLEQIEREAEIKAFRNWIIDQMVDATFSQVRNDLSNTRQLFKALLDVTDPNSATIANASEGLKPERPEAATTTTNAPPTTTVATQSTDPAQVAKGCGCVIALMCVLFLFTFGPLILSAIFNSLLK